MIEMMISITIGLIVIAALVGVLASNTRSSKANDSNTELQSNGRYALDHLKREVRHAGFRGFSWAEPATPTGALAVTNQCGGAGFVQNIRQGIWGANDANPFAASCLSAGYLRGDVLVVRRVATIPASDCIIALPVTAPNRFYYRSTYETGMVFQGSTPPAITGTPCGDFPLVEYVYYIGTDTADATVPALHRVALFTNGAMQDEMIVRGVEHLQVQYGRATTDGNTRYFDANNIPGASTDLGNTNWEDVNSVRIWVLARSVKGESGYTNTDTYTMGNQLYTVNDNFPRQLYTAVIQLRN